MKCYDGWVLVVGSNGVLRDSSQIGFAKGQMILCSLKVIAVVGEVA
jgi:hypothetical protein